MYIFFIILSLQLSIKEKAAKIMALRLEVMAMLQDTLKPEEVEKLRSITKELEQTESDIKNEIEQLINKSQQEAESLLTYMKNIYPDDWIFKLYLADIFIKKEKHKEAEILLLQIIHRYSKVPDAYKKLGYLYENTDKTKALEAYKRALDLQPEDSVLYEKIIILTTDKKELIKEWELKAKFQPNNKILLKYINILKNDNM